VSARFHAPDALPWYHCKGGVVRPRFVLYTMTKRRIYACAWTRTATIRVVARRCTGYDMQAVGCRHVVQFENWYSVIWQRLSTVMPSIPYNGFLVISKLPDGWGLLSHLSLLVTSTSLLLMFRSWRAAANFHVTACVIEQEWEVYCMPEQEI
jgi:hypothetical protein